MEEEKDENTYLKCPDSQCRLFWADDGPCRCDGGCPHGDKMTMVIVCTKCKKEIELPHDHSKLCRIECDDCGACNFHRMSGIYTLRREGDAKRPENN